MNCSYAIVILALLTLLNFTLGRGRVLYPPFIYSFVWLLDCVVFRFSPITTNEVHSVTWLVIIFGAITFSLGGLLTAFVPSGVYKIRVSQFAHPTVSTFGRNVMIGFCVIGLPLLLHEVLNLGASSISGSILAAAREAYTDMAASGQSQIFIISNLPLFSIWITVLCLIEGRDKRFWVAFTLSVICCILTTGRTFILMLLTSLAVTSMLKERSDNLRGFFRFAIIPFFLFAVAFVGLIFLDKDISSFKGDVTAILANFVLAYLVVPIAALDYVLTHAGDYAHAIHHTFEFVFRMLSLLGVDVRIPRVVDTYLYVPLPANVYTIYKYYFTDFGIYGMLGMVAVIGFCQTAIYRRALNGGRVSMFLCSILVYCVVISIFDDAYSGSGLLVLIKAFVVALLYFGVLSRVRVGLNFRRIFAPATASGTIR